MLPQPIFEEVKKLHRYGDAAGFEVGLKFQHPLGEGLMLGLMRGKIGIAVEEHEALFMGKMHGRILHQAGQDFGERSFSLTGGHRGVQFSGEAEKILVLAVDAGDVNTVFRLPLEHTPQIVRNRAKL